MNVLEYNVFDVLFLELQQAVDICQLLMRISGKLINDVLVIISEAVFYQHYSLVNIDAHDGLVVLCDFSLEIIISVLVVNRCFGALGFLLEEQQLFFNPIHEVSTVRCLRGLKKGPE